MQHCDGGSPKPQPLLVLGKIAEILDAFSPVMPVMTVSQLQQTTGLPVSTVHRLVSNMIVQGLLDRSGSEVRVGARMAYWAAIATTNLDVLAVVQPVLEELREITGEAASFFQCEQEFRVCVALAQTRRSLRREMHVGKILPLTVGSAGRVLLAYNRPLLERVLGRPLQSFTASTVTDPADFRKLVEQVRTDGYVVTEGERDDAGSGLSAPVFDATAEIVGAVTISGPTLRMPRERCQEWVDVLVPRAERITRTLGGRAPG
ncbi:MAG: IclR family transcriptional regulator [Rhodococcus sp. (in: high G+C Gram-positive bacteria)]|nr:MAG: IclR family transcriptional regulator [Rhodococcus sp. (in: high G+C Gram-positive bacteria)]